MTLMRQACLLVVALLAGGCSYLFVEGPAPASAPPGGPADCTTDYLWPYTDLTLGVFGGVMAGLIYADADRWRSRNEAYYEAASTLAGALVYLWSARDGRRKVNACRIWIDQGRLPDDSGGQRPANPIKPRREPGMTGHFWPSKAGHIGARLAERALRPGRGEPGDSSGRS